MADSNPKVPPVDKDKFDALLGRLMQTPPQQGKMIKGEPGNIQAIVPLISPPQEPRKA
jgi:hypothetical protein